jgi:Ca2+-binding EF-hand superfamily protein
MDEFPLELVEQAKTLFEKYDKNKNNSIEFVELQALMYDLAKELDIPQPTNEDLQKIMDDIDINKDQAISKEEFLKLYSIVYVMKTMKK